MSINSKIKIKPEVFILVGIVSFFIIINIIWLAIDDMPPSWDDSSHMRISILYSRLIPHLGEFQTLKEIFSLSNFYPPFFHLSSLPLVYFFGFQEDIVIYINFLYLAILVLSLYGIGSLLYNRKIGILSAFLTCLYPIMAGLSRRYLIDFALVAAVSLVHYLILKYKQDRQRRYLTFLIAAVIVSILIKQTAIIFYFAAMALIFLKKDIFKKRPFLFLVVIGLCIFIFYLRYAGHLFFLMGYDTDKFITQDIIKRFTVNMLWYIKALNRYVIMPALVWPLLAGFLLVLIFDKKRERIRYLLIWIVPIFIVCSLFRWRDPRWIMPALPAFAIMTIAGFEAFFYKKSRSFVLAFILLMGLIQFSILSFNLFLIKNSHFCRAPLRQNWKIKEILENIYARHGDKDIAIGIFPDCTFFNTPQFNLYATLKNMQYTVEAVFRRPQLFTENLDKYDIIVTKKPFSTDFCEGGYMARYYEEKIEETLNQYGFKYAKSFDLPDNSKAMIYQK